MKCPEDHLKKIAAYLLAFQFFYLFSISAVRADDTFDCSHAQRVKGDGGWVSQPTPGCPTNQQNDEEPIRMAVPNQNNAVLQTPTPAPVPKPKKAQKKESKKQTQSKTPDIKHCQDLTPEDHRKIDLLCITKKMKIFKVVDDPAFGLAMQEMDDGKKPGAVWALSITAEGKNFNEANDKDHPVCPGGTHPPKEEDLLRLRSSVDTTPNSHPDEYIDPELNPEVLTDLGQAELYGLLPDIKDGYTWSSSPFNQYLAFLFNHGEMRRVWRISTTASVRCVR